ncbi:tetratricopeptide repeat protein [Gemmata sp.]|uniref:tetratricopeptide repeat protein n=1 Tax=Gemmata sp. TaxID=1914242 RepID=UPI003F71B01E
MHAFNDAVNLHKQNKLDEAELIYRQILDENPNHSDAMHLLGVVAHQRGQFGRAVTLIKRAVALAPDAGTYYCNLAEACRMSGDGKGSLEAARRAVSLVPHNPDAHNHLGLALQTLGQYDAAVAAFKEAIDLRPGFALAFNNLGGVYRELEKPDEALAAYSEAVRLAPQLPLALSNLGQALLEKGEKDEAEKYCKDAVRMSPAFPEGLSNLGNVLRAKDNLRDAKDCYRIALKMRPNVAMIHGNLGQALQQEGNLDEAIKCYQQAAALDSKSSRFVTYLASAFAEKENYAEAAAQYRRALELKPDYAEAHNGLGSVLHEQGDFKGAIASFEEALRIKPDFADAYSNLGGAFAELGDMERANHYYREAIRHDPEYVGALSVLATHERDKMPEEDIARMQEFLAREHLTDWKRSTLHHGLAHYYDAKKDYAAAADHAAKGNALRREIWTRQGKAYSADDHTGFISFLMKQFTPDYFSRVKGWGLDTEVPVFVVGMPRSGTTLLEQILGSHPKVFGAGELAIAKDTFDQLPKWMNKQVAPGLCLPEITEEIVKTAGNAHLARLQPHAPDAERIVDKMPDNYMWLGFLATIFPKAKFIYSKRDLHDVAVSCWVTNFKQIRWASDQTEVANRIRNHVRIMDHWRKVLPVPLLEVEYEQTVEDLEAVARKMIDFVGLEWDPACLAFHESKRAVRTASLSQVRQPVYKRSVQRWKNYSEALKPLFDIIDA